MLGRSVDNTIRHMKTKALAIITVITLAFAFALFAQQQRTAQAQQLAPGGPDPKIIAKLSEIVAIRERLFQSYELLLGSGKAPLDGAAASDLAEARIDLARERGSRDEIIGALKDLVSAQERLLKSAQALAIDRLPRSELERVRVSVLQAEVRLLRAQK